MCDDATIEAERGFTRRRFAALTGSIAAGAALAGCGTEPGDGIGAVTERRVALGTLDGTMDAVFFHPEEGAYPGIVLWPDIAGLRRAYEIMARGLAERGYAVLALNHYYRDGTAPFFATSADWRTEEGRAAIEPMRDKLTREAVMRDGAAAAGWLDAQDAVDRDQGLGTLGFCMGGPFAVYTAAAIPERVRAVASFHGAGLVRDDPDSPHRLLARTQAAYLFAIARNDDAAAPDDKRMLAAAARQADARAEVEVYPADHGWVTIDHPVHDPEQAARAWGRMLALFEAAL